MVNICRSSAFNLCRHKLFAWCKPATGYRYLQGFAVMSDNAGAGLNDLPVVDIDAEGRFKYVLVKVYTHADADDTEFRYFVRGHSWGEFHADIYDKFDEQLTKLALSGECVGGGRIEHTASERRLHVFGYSQGFGRADHSITEELLKKRYPDYEISTSNEGY